MSEVRERDLEEEENGLTLDAGESQELQEIFSTIFPQYLLPIEELVGQILDGDVTEEVIEGLRSAISPLASAAETIGASSLGELLREFQDAATSMLDDDGQREANRNRTIDVFYRLKEAVHGLVGQAAAPPPASQDFVRRLTAIDGVDSKDVQRILAAGLGSADQITAGTVDEIASVTGLSEDLAARVRHAFSAAEHEPAAGSEENDDAPSSATTNDPLAIVRDSREPPRGRSCTSPLDARLALVVAVRGRLRLTGLIAQESTRYRRAQASHKELEQAVTHLSCLVEQSREQLTMDRSATRASSLDLRRLQEEVTKAREAMGGLVGPDTANKLAQLHAQLLELCHRVAAPLRGD